MAHSSTNWLWWGQGRGSAVAAATLAAFLAVLHFSSATEIPVGGTGVWEFGDYQAWANRTPFFVGDRIVFNYSPGSHNVITLNQADFAACTVGFYFAKHTTGADYVTLDKAGTVYFSCDLPGHCASMKFSVNVQASAIPPSPSSNQPAPSPSAASSVRYALATVVPGTGVVALLL